MLLLVEDRTLDVEHWKEELKLVLPLQLRKGVAEEHSLSLLQWREKKNSRCCCYSKKETQAPVVAIAVMFLSSVVGTGRHISKNTSKVEL